MKTKIEEYSIKAYVYVKDKGIYKGDQLIEICIARVIELLKLRNAIDHDLNEAEILIKIAIIFYID